VNTLHYSCVVSQHGCAAHSSHCTNSTRAWCHRNDIRIPNRTFSCLNTACVWYPCCVRLSPPPLVPLIHRQIHPALSCSPTDKCSRLKNLRKWFPGLGNTKNRKHIRVRYLASISTAICEIGGRRPFNVCVLVIGDRKVVEAHDWMSDVPLTSPELLCDTPKSRCECTVKVIN